MTQGASRQVPEIAAPRTMARRLHSPLPMHLTEPMTATAEPALFPSDLEQREQEARERERALEASLLALERLHQRLSRERAALAAADAGAPGVPELATRALLRGLTRVREDALAQRLEACALGERRVAEQRAELEQAGEQLGAVAARREAERARAERARAAERAEQAEQAERAERAEQAARRATARGAAAPTRAERRAVRRVGMVAAVSLSSETNFYSGFSSDLSTGGLFIATVEQAPLGAAVSLQFTLPGGAEIEAQGEVRWVRELSPVQPEMMPGLGVAFTEISEAAIAEIARFVAHREPMFFPDA